MFNSCTSVTNVLSIVRTLSSKVTFSHFLVGRVPHRQSPIIILDYCFTPSSHSLSFACRKTAAHFFGVPSAFPHFARSACAKSAFQCSIITHKKTEYYYNNTTKILAKNFFYLFYYLQKGAHPMKIRIPEIVIDIDTQRIQNTAKTAAKKASKTIKTAAQNAKETSKTVKSKAQQAAKDFKETADEYSQKARVATDDLKQEYIRLFNKPKVEQLSSEVADLQYKIMKKDIEIKALQNTQQDGFSVWKAQKEYTVLQKRLEEKTREYNEFAAKQQACQQAFDILNKKNV